MYAMLVDDERKLVWSPVPEPERKPDEVLVEIYAAALNRADLLQRQGKYPSPPGCPEWMGLEIAGVVLEVGEEAARCSHWKPGDRVCALLGGGGYAERVSVRYDMLMPVPKGLTLEQASALPEAFATSYSNLFLEGHLQPGQNVYIAAGASGLASVAIPMVKAFGCRVLTSVRGEQQRAAIARLQADRIVDTLTESLPDAFREEMEAGHPVEVVMDCLAGDDLGKCLPYLEKGGYWILISTLAGVTTEISLRPFLTRGTHFVGSMLRNRPPRVKAEILRQLVEKIWPLIEQGKILPTVCKVLPMSEAAEAHGILERNENVGKVVLRVKEEKI